MKVVCAWCQAHISGDPNLTEVSHGICEGCFIYEMAEMTIKAKALAKDPMPIYVKYGTKTYLVDQEQLLQNIDKELKGC